MAIETDMSELLTSLAAAFSYSLLFDFDWLVVLMINEHLTVVALSNWAFERNVSLTICSDFPSRLTNRLFLTPGNYPYELMSYPCRILLMELPAFQRSAVHFGH